MCTPANTAHDGRSSYGLLSSSIAMMIVVVLARATAETSVVRMVRSLHVNSTVGLGAPSSLHVANILLRVWCAGRERYSSTLSVHSLLLSLLPSVPDETFSSPMHNLRLPAPTEQNEMRATSSYHRPGEREHFNHKLFASLSRRSRGMCSCSVGSVPWCNPLGAEISLTYR